MTKPRNPTYLRRRQERLLLEEDQRAAHRRERELQAAFQAQCRRAREVLGTARRFSPSDLAAAEAAALDPTLRH